FSTAFKRVMNCTPRQYGRGRSPASASAFSTRSEDTAAARWLKAG
ncbi:MAG: AraC family transcriptional regulator, partial [Mesorhizobium sp.]